METIDEKDLGKAEPKPLRIRQDNISESDFKSMLEEMENPVVAQKQMAVRIKIFLDKRIEKEMEEKGLLSDHTRRWVESYNNLLEKIQKALYGEKSVNINLHKVTPSQIAARMRQHEG